MDCPASRPAGCSNRSSARTRMGSDWGFRSAARSLRLTEGGSRSSPIPMQGSRLGSSFRSAVGRWLMFPQPTVFIVDDDAAVRDSLSLLMHSANLPAETFVGGREFLDQVSGDRPGCLVLDVRMPEVDGLELQ